jgi:hypothetical protein
MPGAGQREAAQEAMTNLEREVEILQLSLATLAGSG